MYVVVLMMRWNTVCKQLGNTNKHMLNNIMLQINTEQTHMLSSVDIIYENKTGVCTVRIQNNSLDWHFNPTISNARLKMKFSNGSMWILNLESYFEISVQMSCFCVQENDLFETRGLFLFSKDVFLSHNYKC